jgi:hypothetical protein
VLIWLQTKLSLTRWRHCARILVRQQLDDTIAGVGRISMSRSPASQYYGSIGVSYCCVARRQGGETPSHRAAACSAPAMMSPLTSSPPAPTIPPCFIRSRLRAIASAYVWSPVRWRVYVAINLSTTPLPVRRCYQYANITPARGRDTYTWPHRHPSLARLNFVVSIEIHSYADHNTSQKERRRRKDHGHRKASAK